MVADEENEVLDLTQDTPTPDAEAQMEPYNPEKFHDEARLAIAKRLLWVLVGILVCFVALYVAQIFRGELKTEDIKSFLQIVFPSLITLVSSTIAYYFGTKK